MPNPIKIEDTRDIIEFQIGDNVYKVPLATGMKRPELEKLDTQKALEDFFRKHSGANVWDNLTVGSQNRIAQAWAEENKKASGLSLGE